MSALPVALQAELKKAGFRGFMALRIALPDGDVHVLDGSGTIIFGGMTFTGRDPVYGVLAGIGEIEEGIGNQAPETTVTMFPRTAAALAALAAPRAQGSDVTVWMGAVVSSTGLVVPDPVVIFDGELNTAEQTVGQNSRALQLTCNSVMTRFLQADQGNRLNNGFHQRTWPGQKGLEFITSITRKVPWGAETPKSAIDYPPSESLNARYTDFYYRGG